MIALDTPPLDRLVAATDPAMVIVTTSVGEERAGCLVGFHAQSSIKPGRYCVWISKANHTYRLALSVESFAVHFPTASDHQLAEIFGALSGDEVDKFDLCESKDGPDGVPLLVDCPNRMVCRRQELVDDGGDHVCLVLEPVQVADPSDFEPLRLSMVGDLTPGHEADEQIDLRDRGRRRDDPVPEAATADIAAAAIYS